MVIKMRFDLNHYLPIVEDVTLVSGWQEFATFKYRFIEVKKNQDVDGFPEISHTSILMDYYPEMSWQKDLADTKAAFTNCMIFLNNFIDAYRLASGFEYIRNFNIADLPPYIIIEINDQKTVYILPHFLTATAKPTVSKKIIGKALKQFNMWRMFKPFEIVDKFLSRAIHHMYNEEFVFAIIELQTSFEAYIHLCHHIILEKSGISEEQIESQMLYPLKNTIEQHLSKGLNENLKISENPIMANWNKTLYKMRNSIIHSGLTYINRTEAYDAFDAYQDSINYLSDLMVREKLINPEKTVNVMDLNKNIQDNIDLQKISDELKKRGVATFLEYRN